MNPLNSSSDLPDPTVEFLELEAQLAQEIDAVKAKEVAARMLCLDIRGRLGDQFYEPNRRKIEHVLMMVSAVSFSSYEDFTHRFWTLYNQLG